MRWTGHKEKLLSRVIWHLCLEIWAKVKKLFWDWATFKDVRNEGYFSACEKNCRNGLFCNCVEAYKNRFILQAEASIKKYVEQIVRVSDSYPYILDDQGAIQ